MFVSKEVLETAVFLKNLEKERKEKALKEVESLKIKVAELEKQLENTKVLQNISKSVKDLEVTESELGWTTKHSGKYKGFIYK
jgi:hypothetical protein